MAHKNLLHAVCTTDLCNQLDDFWIPVSSVAANYEKAALRTFGNGEKDARDERFAVVGLLEDFDLLSKP